MSLIEITDEQQARLGDVPKLEKIEEHKYRMPPELYEAEKLRVEKQPDEAMRLCIKFMSENLDHAPAMVLAANIMVEAERYGLAHPLLIRASQLEPKEAIIWNNLAYLYTEMGDFEEAEKAAQKALHNNPRYALGWNSLANVYVHLSKPVEAVRCADKAIELDPKIPEAQFNRSLAKLMLGEFETAWEGYDHNLGRHRSRRERIYGIIPRWTGANDLKIAAYGEQGIGDQIAFSSCIPDLKEKNEVIIECDPKLAGLFGRSFDVPVYGTINQKGIAWPLIEKPDASVAMGSLPGFYRNSRESFTGNPFLVADPERCYQWRALLDKMCPKLKVGIAWTGGIKRTGANWRSLALNDLEPILRQDATFICLQYKDASAEIDKLYREKGLTVHQWRHATLTPDYDDTAALVAELDLVITVTTAAVDLAGGLGKPCWVMVPRKPHWRFLVDGGTTIPWYESVKLYRQYRDDWHNTIAEIATDLRTLCSQSCAS